MDIVYPPPIARGHRLNYPVPMPDELSIACVGARFDNPKRKGQPTGSRMMETMLIERGDTVELRPEPENKADKNAIAIYSGNGVQIGYVSADRTLLLHRAWHDTHDVYAIFQERTPWGAWIRVAFDKEPTLPPLVEKAPTIQPSAGWWPDDAPDDDGADWIPPDE